MVTVALLSSVRPLAVNVSATPVPPGSSKPDTSTKPSAVPKLAICAALTSDARANEAVERQLTVIQ